MAAERSPSARYMDVQLLLCILGLVCFGLVMVYSSSAILAEEKFGSAIFFLKRQALWAFLGLSVMLVIAQTDYHRLREWILPLMLFTLVFLVAVLVMGQQAGGAKRWLRIGLFNFQPSELAKLVVVVALADYLDRRRSRIHILYPGLFTPLFLLALFCGLVAAERDLGTPFLICIVGLTLLFAGGARVTHLLLICSASLPLLVAGLYAFPYRMKRLTVFLDPWGQAQGDGYQLVQSLLALGSGGWFGKGLGSSNLKLHYLPEPHTDFIFPIIGEELGFVGVLALCILFTYLIVRGFRIALKAPDLYGSILALGVTLLIGVQAILHIAVATGSIPTKGLPLPFLSYGGSALLSMLLGIGILLNVSCHPQHSRR